MLEKLKNKSGIDRDDIIGAIHRQYPNMSDDEFVSLKAGWRKASKVTGDIDDGCGHGLIRFPYDREFTPCHCGMPISNQTAVS